MKSFVLMAVSCVVLSGCVSMTTYKKDMAKINQNIETQNNNVDKTSQKFKELDKDITYLKLSLENTDAFIWGRGGLKARIEQLEAFKKIHDKRWPWLEGKEHLPVKKEKK